MIYTLPVVLSPGSTDNGWRVRRARLRGVGPGTPGESQWEMLWSVDGEAPVEAMAYWAREAPRGTLLVKETYMRQFVRTTDVIILSYLFLR